MRITRFAAAPPRTVMQRRIRSSAIVDEQHRRFSEQSDEHGESTLVSAEPERAFIDDLENLVEAHQLENLAHVLRGPTQDDALETDAPRNARQFPEYGGRKEAYTAQVDDRGPMDSLEHRANARCRVMVKLTR